MLLLTRMPILPLAYCLLPADYCPCMKYRMYLCKYLGTVGAVGKVGTYSMYNMCSIIISCT